MRSLLTLIGCLSLLLAAAAAPAQKDKDKGEKLFSGKTIAEWVKQLSSDDVGDRRLAAMVLQRAEVPTLPSACRQ